MKKLQVEWIAIDGCIYTEKTHKIQTPSGLHEVRESIAFNVGQDAAEHIVRLHNQHLNGQSS